MPIITTTGLDDSVRVQYEADYLEGAQNERIYDQFATPVEGMAEMKRGTSVTIPVISKLAPSSQTMSETDDLVPQTFVDTTVSVTPTSLGNAVKWSEKVELTTYTNGVAKKISFLGENMQDSIEQLALNAALAGSLVRRVAASRAALDAGTSTHRLGRDAFVQADSILAALRVPQFITSRGARRMALFNPWALPDLVADTVITAVSEYQRADIVLNGEIGELWGWKLLPHANAKVFYGAGAANASAISTTLAADANELSTTITVAANTNIDVGDRIMIGTVESSSTFYPTNESVIVSSVNSTTIGVIGMGENGGLRFAHASGDSVKNTDNVVPVVFGGPESLAKVFDPEIGEYGQLVGPKKSGLADQWTTMAWKFYGGYGIIAQNRILRGEYSISLDA